MVFVTFTVVILSAMYPPTRPWMLHTCPWCWSSCPVSGVWGTDAWRTLGGRRVNLHPSLHTHTSKQQQRLTCNSSNKTLLTVQIYWCKLYSSEKKKCLELKVFNIRWKKCCFFNCFTLDPTELTIAAQPNQQLVIHSAKCKWLSKGLILRTNPRRPLRSQSVHKMIDCALPPPHSKPTRFSNGYSVLRSYHGELLFWRWVQREAAG